MKSLAVVVITIFTSFTMFAQNITGKWNGILKVPGMQIRIAFNVTKTNSGYKSTMDSPDQKAFGIPVETTDFTNGIVKFAIPKGLIEYQGTANDDSTIIGYLKQAGQSFPLNLSRTEAEKEKVLRPQEPIKPYPYYAEDVTFQNKKANITLAGTLTLPNQQGNFPAVVLISGSGPENRDEEIMGHKPFLVLSDFLTKNGIAVLRFDDRGTAQSKGNFSAATSADFATDVEAAVNYLLTRKEIIKSKIGLMGHSEGGIIAPMVAVQNKNVSFIVLLAGTGIPGDQLLLLQQELVGRAMGASDIDLLKEKTINTGAYKLITKSTDNQKLKTELTTYYTKAYKDNPIPDSSKSMSTNDLVNFQVKTLTTSWIQYFIKYNPQPTLQKVKCPVLAVNGSKDLQVPAQVNLDAIKNALTKGGNKNVTIKELPGLNHLFQECTTGSPNEYATIQQTFSPTAMAAILSWLQTQIKP
ncbi:MAG TPA: alpha/beta fold hydrolase [Bacteroidia bacterium]|jgi:dipeptidyl aminopeptidase/acylaminoacyl peptidase|nr:alpha/beta fold hydrolase [Bacteroidia bacterium]